MFYKTLVLLLLAVLCKCVKVEVVTDKISPKPTFTFLDRFEPTWESLDSRLLPPWYDQAKVGIFIHWGVYSVPSYGSEWFWTNWRTSGATGYVDFMQKNYKPGFTYQDFARDFTAELFNATEWTDIFEKSGAKYVVLTSKHHDGYALWPSKYSFSWNSVDVGPHRDIIDELSRAIRKSKVGLRFGLYHSLFEWYNPLYMDDRNHSFLISNFVDNKVMPELKELVEMYEPEVIWSDGEWEASYTYWKSREFLAWLYNDSPVRKTVVSNDRWGMETLCKHGDFHTCADRFNPGVLQRHKWENAMTIDKRSWGHRANAKLEDFVTSKELIRDLVITVSCGGNILVNVGPTKAGTIEAIFVERLQDMGRWLQMNGEAIYDSVPWTYQNDTHTPDIWYTSGKLGEERAIYAIVLSYPYDSNGIHLYALAGIVNQNTQITMLGYNTEPLKWDASSESIFITFPNKALLDKNGLDFAWTLKITNQEDNIYSS